MNWRLSQFLNPCGNIVYRWVSVTELELLVDAANLHLHLLGICTLEVIDKIVASLVKNRYPLLGNADYYPSSIPESGISPGEGNGTPL